VKWSIFTRQGKFPENYLWHPNAFDHLVVLHMPMSKFEFVMSMVRLEKPLNLYTEANQGGIATYGKGYLTTRSKATES
jgi:hypothetical protein